jgi:hypothetical protein
LYNYSIGVALAIELGLFILGVVTYITYVVKNKSVGKSPSFEKGK